MKSQKTIQRTVLKIISRNTPLLLQNISPRMEFVKDLQMGRFDYLLTLAEIEHKLNIDIPDELAYNFKTVGQMLQCLTEALEEKSLC